MAILGDSTITDLSVINDMQVNGLFTKPLIIKSSINGAYNEGIRITKSSNNWAGMVIGCNAGSASGAPSEQGGWFIANDTSNRLIINNTDSGTANSSIWINTDKTVNIGKATITTLNGVTVGSSPKFTDTVYTHPTSAGNIHLPSGGASGNFLKWSSAGTGKWESLTKTEVTTALGYTPPTSNTTYSAGTGLSLSSTTFNHSNSVTAGTAGTSSATSGSTLAVPYVTYDAQGHITATGTHTHTVTGFAASSHGNHVPATQTANNAVFLRNDNSWQTVTPANIGAAASSHTHSYAGSASAGGPATTLAGTYSGNGGALAPSAVAGGNVKAAMMNNPKGLSKFPTYADSILMDTYTGSDVPWVTMFSIVKQDADPRAFISVGAKGNTTTWKYSAELLTENSTLNASKLSGLTKAQVTTALGYTPPTSNTTYAAGTGLSLSGTTFNHSNSVTAGTAGTSSATSGSTLAVPYVTFDAQGHVTAVGTHTHTVTGFAATSHGNHVPATQTANNAVFLRNDNTWQTVTPANIGAAASSHTHSNYLTAHQTIKQNGVTGATGNCYGACSTAAATAAKAVSITAGTPTLEAGLKVTVKFTYANTASSPTLNVNSLGAKNIAHNGSQITSGANKALLAGVCDFVYDGNQFHLVGNYIDTNTQTITGVKGNSESTYRTGNVNLTAANIGAAASNHNHNGTYTPYAASVGSNQKFIYTNSSGVLTAANFEIWVTDT